MTGKAADKPASHTRRGRMSPAYTTRWEDLPKVS